ncbi:hypothetical protein JTB14_038401 [Gonioctena quinquepunctata]|nr:hypothetical protein JTB14_038401 [Gonioctena quinquepunctata]
MAGLINILGGELYRRERQRQINKTLRDHSDPFQMPEENFRQFFRLSREAAFDLFLEIEPHMEVSRRNTRMAPVIRFISSLHFFAHGSYQKSVGKDSHCALSQPSVSKCLKEVVSIMNEHLGHHYIHFPSTVREIAVAKNRFFERFNFPGIVGCIDCTHIAIVPPPANDLVYPGLAFINRKNYHSINCQIVCDADLKIRHINARYPGSVHDAAIWIVSNLREFLLENFHNARDRHTWLLGDSGYPLQPFLLTPIVGADPNTPDGRYTESHVRTRNVVERCIGVLKAYFRCLRKDRVLHYKPDKLPK